MTQMLFIASQDPSGGIVSCELSPDGILRARDFYPAGSPAYLCSDGKHLHAVLREPFMMQSGVVSYEILPDGTLRQTSEVQPVHGTISAHIVSFNDYLFTANYLSGSVTRLPDKVKAFQGKGINRLRQECSHPHCITPSPDGKYICICDLGTDCIYVCNDELEEVSRVRVHAGAGVRHLVFSPSGEYAFSVNELSSTVSSYAYCDGCLTLLDTYDALPDTYEGSNSASAIRISPDGQTLYVSNRGHDSVAIFTVQGERLVNRRFLLTQGKSPRDINLAGNWLLCANEDSNMVSVFPADANETDLPTSTCPIVRPGCILPVDLPSLSDQKDSGT